MTPAWISDIVAAVMLVVAAVSAARLVAARPWQQRSVVLDTDVAHLLMAIAMAGMLATSLATLSNTAWEVVFGLMTAWFAVRVVLDARASGVRALAGGHCAPHLVHSAAMLYMFLAINMSGAGMSGGGMSGMSGGSGSMTLDHPTIAFIFALILIGYTIWDLDRLSGRRYSPGMLRVALAGAGTVKVPAMAVAETGSGAPPASPAAGAADSQPAVHDQAMHDQAMHDQAMHDQAVHGTGGGGVSGAGGYLLSPGVMVGCRIAMGIAMAFMLIIAI